MVEFSVTLTPQNSLKCKTIDFKLVVKSNETVSNPSSEFVIGRNRECEIKDTRISRQHAKIELRPSNSSANCHGLHFVNVGRHPCLVRDEAVKPNQAVSLCPGDKIGLLPDEFIYEIHFTVNFGTEEEVQTVKPETKLQSPVSSSKNSLSLKSEAATEFKAKEASMKINNMTTSPTVQVHTSENCGKFRKRDCTSLNDYFKSSPTKIRSNDYAKKTKVSLENESESNKPSDGRGKGYSAKKMRLVSEDLI